jgi:hypothetical protein
MGKSDTIVGIEVPAYHSAEVTHPVLELEILEPIHSIGYECGRIERPRLGQTLSNLTYGLFAKHVLERFGHRNPRMVMMEQHTSVVGFAPDLVEVDWSMVRAAE